MAALAAACGQDLTSWGPGAEGGQDGDGEAGQPAASGAQNSGGTAGSSDDGSKGGKLAKGGSAPDGNGGSTGGSPAAGGDIAAGGTAGMTSGGTANGGNASGGNASGGNGGSGGAAESPVTQDGLELWLRAEQGVTLEDDRVSIWKDASPHHRDAAQSTSDYQPVFGADALNGKPGVAFDGANDYLALPALDADFSAGLSAFIVLERDESNNSCEGFFEASNGSDVDDINFGDWRHALHFEVNENYVNEPMYPLVIGAPQIAAVLKAPGEMGDTLLRSNSKAAGAGSTGVIQKVTRTRVYLGRSLYADCGLVHGIMGEVLLYSRRVSDDELQHIEGYLQKKWGCCGG